MATRIQGPGYFENAYILRFFYRQLDRAARGVTPSSLSICSLQSPSAQPCGARLRGSIKSAAVVFGRGIYSGLL